MVQFSACSGEQQQNKYNKQTNKNDILQYIRSRGNLS